MRDKQSESKALAMAIDAATKKKPLMPTPALCELIDLSDKLSNARANHRGNNPTVQDDSKEPAFLLELSPAECSAVIDLVGLLNEPKAIARKYWHKPSFPTKQPWEKLAAARAISQEVARGQKPTKALFEKVGLQYDLKEDQAEHAFRDFGRRPGPSKRRSKSQSDK